MDDMTYSIGYPDYEARHALNYLIEAARALCAMDYDATEDLLVSAARELKSVRKVAA